MEVFHSLQKYFFTLHQKSLLILVKLNFINVPTFLFRGRTICRLFSQVPTSRTLFLFRFQLLVECLFWVSMEISPSNEDLLGDCIAPSTTWKIWKDSNLSTRNKRIGRNEWMFRYSATRHDEFFPSSQNPTSSLVRQELLSRARLALKPGIWSTTRDWCEREA